MKTTSVILIALTLISGCIEASENTGSRRVSRPPRRRVPVAAPAPAHFSDTRPLPVHVLFQNLPAASYGSSFTTAAIIPDEKDAEVAQKATDLTETSSGTKRPLVDESMKDAVYALLSISNSGEHRIVEIEDEIRADEERTSLMAGASSRQRKVAKKAAGGVSDEIDPLLKLTEKNFYDGKIKNFSAYFDARNMETEGSATLFKCFYSSRFLGLAKYLIKNGAQFPEMDNDTLLAAFTVAMSGEHASQTSVSILAEMLKINTMEAIKLFVKVAGVSSDPSAIDAFLCYLLTDEETSVVVCSSPDVPQFFKMLAENRTLPGTLIFLCNHFDGDLIEGIVFAAIDWAIHSRNADLIEVLLEKGLVSLSEIIVLSDKQPYNLASRLFGHIDSERIMRLLKKFNYPLDFTHNPTFNPKGDILLAAVLAKDLPSFKRLLLAGASYDIKVSSSMDLETLLSSRASTFVGFYEALSEFKEGKLTL